MQHSELKDPFQRQAPFYVLVETHGSNYAHDDEKITLFLERVVESEVVQEGTIAQDQTQQKYFWDIRESIPEACSKEGGIYKYDLSVPVEHLYQVVLDMRQRLRKQGLYDPELDGKVKHIVGFGHVGDGNLHMNIMTSGRTKDIDQAIEPFVYETIKKYEGSISAEHGLGQVKNEYLEYSKSREFIDIMRGVKKLFDPKGILNPGKYFPTK
jgi:D-lactate dehydrogenase (cytochrome)